MFNIEAKLPNGRGRAGRIETPHGAIETPAFIPVGTKATVKSLAPEQVRDLGAQAVLSNTYHLYLQPGPEVLRASGGLGKFMHWDGPTFTDSGGFQAFSLQGGMKNRKSKFGSKGERVIGLEGDREPQDLPYDPSTLPPSAAAIDDDGVTFKSIIDGSEHRFTPEISIDIQHAIGADIIFALDECAPPEAPYEAQQKALRRTHDWAARCLAHHHAHSGPSGRVPGSAGTAQALFGIVQGGRHQELRMESARAIGEMNVAGADGSPRSFDGFGIGGTFDKDDVGTVAGWVADVLPEGKPRHLLGIGEPGDLILGIENGMDTFDCVAPTRMARNGSVYVSAAASAEAGTANGRLNLLNARFVNDTKPLDQSCTCYTCKNYSRVYVAHLFRAKEMFAATLASIHNVHFLVELTKEARKAIVEGKWEQFKRASDF